MKKIQGTPDWDTIPVMPIDNHLWEEPAFHRPEQFGLLTFEG